jgi:uncharacterized repeat protein (TIGR03803 family)
MLLFTARPAVSQTETVLYNFPAGAVLQGGLVFDKVGNLYGINAEGGASGAGEVYELSPNGNGGWNYSTIYSFTGGADGSLPYRCTTIIDEAGNLYGTTGHGGAYGYGVVFEVSPIGTSWKEAVLHSFNGVTEFPDAAWLWTRGATSTAQLALGATASAEPYSS